MYEETKSQAPTAISVEQLNQQIKMMIEGQLHSVWVRGEISNFKPHSSGHHYFSLKDSKSQIKAVMFRGNNLRLKFKPVDGLEVIVRGKISVYEPRGDYQIVIDMMEPVGAGALQRAFEQLKLKLKNEGLFDTSKKRFLPILPRHIAIVTSPTGAAVRDMINVLTRRYKSVNVTIVPTLVQGEGAAPQICLALDKAYSLPEVDVVIVGRGGGSIEDLWAFNEEIVARKIAESPVPIISAVGHEIDFTIADFVADVRAPTPSAAAELVVKNAADLTQHISSLKRMLIQHMAKWLSSERHKLHGLTRNLVDPKRRIYDLILRRDELELRLLSAREKYFEKQRMKILILQKRMISPLEIFNRIQNRFSLLKYKLKQSVNLSLEHNKHQLSQLMGKLDALSPLKVVDRGYSLVTVDKKVVKNIKQIKKGDEINVRFAKGQVRATVNEIVSDKKESE